LLHFREHGKKAIEKVAREQPASYLKILALLVPREHKVEYSNSLKNWTDEELDAGIDLVKQMLESRAAASGAVIEGQGSRFWRRSLFAVRQGFCNTSTPQSARPRVTASASVGAA
jgi:hypothetical protein